MRRLYSTSSCAFHNGCYNIVIAKKPYHVSTIRIGLDGLLTSKISLWFGTYENEHEKGTQKLCVYNKAYVGNNLNIFLWMRILENWMGQTLSLMTPNKPSNIGDL